MRRRAAATMVLTAGLLGGGAAAPAHAAWTRPERIAGPAEVEGASLASDGRGNRVASWWDRAGVHLSFAHRGGRFGSSRLIAATAGGTQARAWIRGGRGAAAWYVDDRLQVALIRDEAVSPAVQLGSATVRAAAVSPDGAVAVVYSDQGGATYARVAAPGAETLGPPEAVAAGAAAWGAYWGDDGRLEVEYSTGAYPASGSLAEATRVGAGAFRQRTLLTTTYFSPIAADLDQGGHQAVAWFGRGSMWLGAREAGRPMEARSFRWKERRLHVEAIAVGASGDALAVMSDGRQRLGAATRRPGRRFTRPRFTAVDTDLEELSAAVAPSGTGLVAWSRSSPRGPSLALAATVNTRAAVHRPAILFRDRRSQPQVEGSAWDARGAVLLWRASAGLVATRLPR